MRRITALIAGLFIAIAVLAGCSHSTPVSYAPAAYGQQVGGAYDCYYVNYPDEVTTLVAHGLCPAGSVATRMPGSWLNEYFPYYDSDAYYGTYIPVAYRTVYVSTYRTYYVQHTAVINTASKSATWKGSNGKTVSGAKVNTAKMKFSTGSGSNSTMGGGSLRGGSTKASTGGVGAAKASSGASGSSGVTKTSTTKKKSSSVGGSLRRH